MLNHPWNQNMDCGWPAISLWRTSLRRALQPEMETFRREMLYWRWEERRADLFSKWLKHNNWEINWSKNVISFNSSRVERLSDALFTWSSYNCALVVGDLLKVAFRMRSQFITIQTHQQKYKTLHYSFNFFPYSFRLWIDKSPFFPNKCLLKSSLMFQFYWREVESFSSWNLITGQSIT